MATSASDAAGACSTATIAAGTVAACGTHVLKVDGYTKTKDALRVVGCLLSGEFQVGGHTWCIHCHPRGNHEKGIADWVVVCLHLCHTGDDEQIKARFSFTLLGPDGETADEFTETIEYTFMSTRCIYACALIENEELESSRYLKDDSFRVRCDVTVVKDFHTSEAAAQVPAVPSQDLIRDLGRLLTGKVGGDVTFKVDGELFTAHKCVLAAGSPVFMAELFGPGNENTSTAVAHILIDDMKPEVFRAVLHFIYTDSLPEICNVDKTAMLQRLIVAADRYNLERLKLMCEDRLSNYVDARTEATLLLLAKEHGCCRLKESCMRLLRDLLASVDP